MKQKLLITDVLRRDFRARRFCNRLAKSLIRKGGNAKQINNDKKAYFEKIRSSLIKIDNNYQELKWYLIPYIKSFEQAVEYLKMFSKSKKLGFDNYFNFNTVASLLRKGKKNLDFYFNLARSFEHHKLDENEQGNFTKFGDYDSVDDDALPKFVDIMISTKDTGFPLSQKNIVKFYDAISNIPSIKESCNNDKELKEKYFELLESYKSAWIFQNEKNVEIKTIDYIQAVKNDRTPFYFVVDFERLKDNDIPLSYKKYKILPLSEPEIRKFVGYLIKAKFSGIIIEPDEIYQEIIKKFPVNTILEFYIKFYKVGCKDYDYIMLRNLHFMGGDLKKFFEGYILNQKTSKLSASKLYEKVFKILSIAILKPKFDTFLFVLAINKGKENNVSVDEIVDDYISGYNVFTILDYVDFARKNKLNLSYGMAKFIDKFCDRSKDENHNCIKETINKTLYPVFIDGKSFLVTTKDNIEIRAKMKIEAIFVIENYFKGSDEKVLLDRASAIFTDEIQRKYNHDEIIINIEKISNNVLDRLLKETRSQVTQYFGSEEMIKIENSHGHDEVHKEEIHNDVHHQDNTHEKEKHHDDTHHEALIEHSENSFFPQQSDNKDDRFIKNSKYKPLKVLIPKIEFVEATFKEFEKLKHHYEHELHQHAIDFKKQEMEIDLKKEWARGHFNKYIIFKDDDGDITHEGHKGKDDNH